MKGPGRPQEYAEGRITSVFLEFDILERLEAEATTLRTSRSKLIADIIEWYFKSETERIAKLKHLENKVKKLEKKLEEVEKEKEALERRLDKRLEEKALSQKLPSQMTPEELEKVREKVRKRFEEIMARKRQRGWL
ncbi:MAG: hypothetical protein J7J91_04390 [Deltaproteobacteria bacterium]|nr:hypothetical protein [Deltaproteobacteria bacterium]